MSKKITVKSIIVILALAFAVSGYFLIITGKASLKPFVHSPARNAGGVSVSLRDQLAAQTKIKRFKNYKELKEFMEKGPIGSSGYLARGDMFERMPGAARSMDMAKQSDAGINEASASGANDYSTTNIQVKGVDEPDIIKTDGKYIYAVSGNNLFIVDAYPAKNADILAKIEFKSRPRDIFINGDSLIVFGRNYNIRDIGIYKTLNRRSGYVFFKVFNIKDRKNPKLERDLSFEGNYFNSRMIGDYVYFITSIPNYSYYYDEKNPLPVIVKNDKVVLGECAGRKCAMPPVYYFNIPYDRYNFTDIAAINIKNNKEDIKREIYALSGNQNMYVSQNNIYITYTKYINEQQLRTEVMKRIIYPMLPPQNQERVKKIEAVENFILSRAEKTRKISMILERFFAGLTEGNRKKLNSKIDAAMKKKYKDAADELEKTVIHKIAINKGAIRYKNSGEVSGRILNQFSMDEKGGYFRIATTNDGRWLRFTGGGRQESSNNLYVLDGNLKIVGALRNLARGEKIYSVRFMQDRAYMVTFKRIDPLFVINLKDPKNPKVLGKLKIPGFSNYLHPYGKNILIGIGKEVKDNGKGRSIAQGIKLSLFDVSDVANPKEIDNYVLGGRGSDSIALRDHKAFLFSKEKHLLVIPVSLRESDNGKSYSKLVFNGAAVFKVDKTGFDLKGKIDHSDESGKKKPDRWGSYGYRDNSVKRSLYIGDILYTFSAKYLKMNKLDDLKLVKDLELKKEKAGENNDFKIIN